MTRVLVCGERDWPCFDLVDRIVERLRLRYGRDLVIVHGCARGVDGAFDSAAKIRGISCEPHPAKWEVNGLAGGPIRNQAMVDAGAAFLICVHRDLAGSKGSRDCVDRALGASIPCFLIDREDGEPRRIVEIPQPRQRSLFDDNTGR